MHKVTPIKHEDGTETVRLYGTTVDVTGLKKFTLFKKDYKVVRPRKKKDEVSSGNHTDESTETSE